MSFRSLSNLFMTPWPEHHIVASSSTSSIEWQQFHRDVSQLAGCIRQSGQQRWAVCTKDSYWFAVAFFAVIQADCHVILPGNYQPAALAELAEHFDAIVHDGVVHEPQGLHSLQLPVKTTQIPKQPLKPIAPGHVYLTLFTSGSSGKPKVIEKNLAEIEAELAVLESLWGELLSDAHIASTVSHQHIYGLLFRVLWPLCGGRTFDRHNLDYPEQVIQHAGHNMVLISSPALLKRLKGKPVTASYRAIFSSGGPLPFDAVEECRQLLHQRPFEIFGSTETGGIGYRQQLHNTMPWLLLPGIKTDQNQEGCLRLNSPFISSEDWYQTTDICEFLDSGRFILKGRSDRIVKIEEKRISLPEIEQRLSQLAWIEEAAVIPQELDQRLTLAAVITLTPSGKALLAENGSGKFWLTVRQSLRQWLEPVALPRRIRIVDSIPVNSQGKRLQNELRSLLYQ